MIIWYLSQPSTRILSKFQKPDSLIRIIISTDSLSTGVHFPDIPHIISYGMPDSIVQFWQQAGQAGHHDILLFCLLYATRHSYHKRNDQIQDLVKAAIAKKKRWSVCDTVYSVTSLFMICLRFRLIIFMHLYSFSASSAVSVKEGGW